MEFSVFVEMISSNFFIYFKVKLSDHTHTLYMNKTYAIFLDASPGVRKIVLGCHLKLGPHQFNI